MPLVGDTTSAAERAADVTAWAFGEDDRAAFYEVVRSRRDIRKYRPDPVPGDVLRRVLAAAHTAPSVGQSQPWRFVVVTEAGTRERAAWMADRERLSQAAQLDDGSARHFLDLQLEGIRQAPIGIVVGCDRRAPAAGVLGRATFPDADLWSCACAIQNLWLAARAEGLGVGWVTLFQPSGLADLLHLPDGVVPLGWLCLGWPDERPPEPGLERAAWSVRLPLEQVVLHERWPADGDAPRPPVSRLRAPDQRRVVAATDEADGLLTAPRSLGVLDAAVDRLVALAGQAVDGGTLVLAAGRHPVAGLGVTAYDPHVTDEVVRASRAGESMAAAAAASAGLAFVVVDGGWATGDLVRDDAMPPSEVAALIEEGRAVAERACGPGLIAVGEVGVGNTTVGAALAALLLGLDADAVVGLGAASDTSIVDRKRVVIASALARVRSRDSGRPPDPLEALAAVGGPEVALLTGVVLGAVEGGAAVILDGLVTSVAALVAAMLEPAVTSALIAGQRSRELAHATVLEALGLEPLLDLRLRAGEGVGAALASRLLLAAVAMRRHAGRTFE